MHAVRMPDVFPTPTAKNYGTNQGGGAGRVGKVRPSLQTMARRDMWPTPMKSDATKGKGSVFARGNATLQKAAGGLLNPDWEESHLMGWPIGWTALEPLATARFLEWLLWHSRLWRVALGSIYGEARCQRP